MPTLYILILTWAAAVLVALTVLGAAALSAWMNRRRR